MKVHILRCAFFNPGYQYPEQDDFKAYSPYFIFDR